MVRHFLSIADAEEHLVPLLDLAAQLKQKLADGERYTPLTDKSLAMIFERPSTRTRISFETGMTQLGGHALYLSPKDLQLGRGETIADTARTVSRFVDIIMYRAFENTMMTELAAHSRVPVINALDDLEHPCQIMADLLTMREHKPSFPDITLAYIGDGNNVCNSLLLGAALAGVDLTIGCPRGYDPDTSCYIRAQRYAEKSGATIELVHDAVAAVEGADVVYTDVWVSMGDEEERARRLRQFAPYQLDHDLLAHACDDASVMHCLPAHRGEEITDAVIDGTQSVVFDQAENRLHAQKAIMSWLIEGDAVLE